MENVGTMENTGAVENLSNAMNEKSKDDYIAELVYENEKLKLENEALRKILGEKEQHNQQNTSKRGMSTTDFKKVVEESQVKRR